MFENKAKIAVNGKLLTRFSKASAPCSRPSHKDVVNGNNAGAIICLTYIHVGDEVIEHFKRIDASHELIEEPFKDLMRI